MNDNDSAIDEDIEFIFEHGCGRYIRVEAHSFEFDDDGELYHDYSGYLVFHADVPMPCIQCRIEDALGWNGRLVISWIK